MRGAGLGLTHVDPLPDYVVDDLVQTNDMGVPKLLHDGDLLANLLLRGIELVSEGEVIGIMIRGKASVVLEHLVALCLGVVPLDGLYRLVREERSLNEVLAERENWTHHRSTPRVAFWVAAVEAKKDLSMLTDADASDAHVLVQHRLVVEPLSE